MREVYRVQLGVPLDEDALSAMVEGERSFWLDFFEEAKQVIAQKRANGEEMPFQPPQSLAEKYQRALAEFDGGKYCSVRQLQQIFRFGQ